MPTELSEVPEDKTPKGTNQYITSATAIIIAFFSVVGFYFTSKKADCPDTGNYGPAFSVLAKDYAAELMQSGKYQLHIQKLQIDSANKENQRSKENTYIKKKVLNPLKKQYHGR